MLFDFFMFFSTLIWGIYFPSLVSVILLLIFPILTIFIISYYDLSFSIVIAFISAFFVLGIFTAQIQKFEQCRNEIITVDNTEMKATYCRIRETTESPWSDWGITKAYTPTRKIER